MTNSSLDTASAAQPVAQDRYTLVAIMLHWAIAGLILFNLGVGFFMESWPPPIRFLVLMLHASSGLTVLGLTIARIIWRLVNAPPPYPPQMKTWERHTAHFVHFFLYAAMVLMPLSGWAILSAHAPPGSHGSAVEFASRPGAPAGKGPGAPPAQAMPPRPMGPPPVLKIWTLVPMPMIEPISAIGQEPGGVAPLHKLHEEFVEWHSVGAFLLLGLFFLHLGGALKHQFIDKQAELERMGAGRKRA